MGAVTDLAFHLFATFSAFSGKNFSPQGSLRIRKGPKARPLTSPSVNELLIFRFNHGFPFYNATEDESLPPIDAGVRQSVACAFADLCHCC